MKVEWDEVQTAVVRQLLIHGWPALSRGDRSVILQSLATPGSAATAVTTTPHADFWESMICLGWAEEGRADFLPEPIRVFSFNASGADIFPAFVERFDLLNVVVREEEAHVIDTLTQHMSDVMSEVSHLGWQELAKRTPETGTRAKADQWGHYIATTWDTSWRNGPQGPVAICVNGFLHAGHHRPVLSTTKTIPKPNVFGSLAHIIRRRA